MTTEQELPDFEALPVKPGNPLHSAWGLWGDDDEVGTLNLLTEERVLAAAGLVRTGKVFPLNWELELPDPPFFRRETLRHQIKSTRRMVNEDVYHDFNTQSSSQWDGLTHYGNTLHQSFYNGVKPADITGQPGTRNGMQVWARRGIAGRGVLLDYARWAEANGVALQPGTRQEIPASHLEAVAQAQGVTFQTGDILVVRSGWMKWYLEQDQATRTAYAGQIPPQAIGLTQGDESLRFLWNNHFAAVAGDTLAFEVYPALPGMAPFMHETILALWGMPIGEMFYLEALADACSRDGRYEFFLTSAPLNKLGGVASPPNALAIK